MRKILGALLAFAAMPVASGYAADMALKAPPAAAAAVYNWTGFYVGGEVGGGWARNTTTVVTPGALFPVAGTVLGSTDSSGALAGGYAGYNYQINQIVLGIDGNYDWAGLTGSSTDVGAGGATLSTTGKVRWDSAITGRLGYAQNNWLFFVKGGWAWARFDGSGNVTGAGGAVTGTVANSTTRNGGTVGVGVEYGFAQHWSAKLEYDYVKFRTASFNNTNTAFGPPVVVSFPSRSATSDLNELKAGIAYRF